VGLVPGAEWRVSAKLFLLGKKNHAEGKKPFSSSREPVRGGKVKRLFSKNCGFRKEIEDCCRKKNLSPRVFDKTSIVVSIHKFSKKEWR